MRTGMGSIMFVTLCMAGCSSPQPARPPDSASDANAIAAAMTGYTAAVKSGDAAKVAGWWTEDAVFISPGTRTIHGRVGIDSILKGMLAEVRVAEAAVTT